MSASDLRTRFPELGEQLDVAFINLQLSAAGFTCRAVDIDHIKHIEIDLADKGTLLLSPRALAPRSLNGQWQACITRQSQRDLHGHVAPDTIHRLPDVRFKVKAVVFEVRDGEPTAAFAFSTTKPDFMQVILRISQLYQRETGNSLQFVHRDSQRQTDQ